MLKSEEGMRRKKMMMKKKRILIAEVRKAPLAAMRAKNR